MILAQIKWLVFHFSVLSLLQEEKLVGIGWRANLGVGELPGDGGLLGCSCRG